jgi:hypothetical protein
MQIEGTAEPRAAVVPPAAAHDETKKGQLDWFRPHQGSPKSEEDLPPHKIGLVT